MNDRDIEDTRMPPDRIAMNVVCYFCENSVSIDDATCLNCDDQMRRFEKYACRWCEDVYEECDDCGGSGKDILGSPAPFGGCDCVTCEGSGVITVKLPIK